MLARLSGGPNLFLPTFHKRCKIHNPLFLFERAGTPALDPAHFGVEIPFEIVIEVDDQAENTPAQLSRQCSDNLLFRENFGELDHAPQVFF